MSANLKERAAKIQKRFFQLGNVDLLDRPQVQASVLTAKGWSNAGTGTATVFSVLYSAGSQGVAWGQDIIIHVTPILKSGTVLTPSELDSYIDELLQKTTVNDVLAYDHDHKKNILWIQTNVTDWDKACERGELFDELLHGLQAVYYLEDYNEFPTLTRLRKFNRSINFKDAIIEIYFKHYNIETINDQNEIVETLNSDENLVQTIPASDGEEIVMLSPNVKNDIGNAESMDFSIQPGTIYYNSLIQMRSYIRVVYDGDTIFYGRVLTLSDGFFGERKVHCEGALAFMNDSYYPAVEKKSQVEKTVFEHIKSILDNHNAQVYESAKKLYPGEVPGNYSYKVSSEQRIENQTRKYDNSSWSNTKSAIEDLKNHFGGAFRVRYDEHDNKCYLDWFDHYYRSTVRNQKIEIGKNLIDVSRSNEISNVFTAIIPIGKGSSGDGRIYLTGYNGRENNYMYVDEICKTDINGATRVPAGIYTDEELNSGYHTAEDYKTARNKYGIIFKTVDLQEAHSQEELFTQAAKWIKNNYQGGVDTFSVKAIDMHLIGNNVDNILIGDRVKIQYPVGSSLDRAVIKIRTLTCTSITYDLFNPENNQYTFGIPANMLGKTYGDSSEKDHNNSSYNPPSNDNDIEQDGTTLNVINWLRNHKFWKHSTNDTESGPDERYPDGSHAFGYFLDELISLTSEGNHQSRLLIPIPLLNNVVPESDPDGGTRARYSWRKLENGLPRFGRVFVADDDITLALIDRYHLLEYIYDEYGIDFRTGFPQIELGNNGEIIVNTPGSPSDTIDGMLDNPIVKKIIEIVPGAESVVNIFNNNGVTVAKILGENGDFQFIELDDEGNPATEEDENGNLVYKYIDARSIKRDTESLAYALEAAGHTVERLDKQVTLIGQKVDENIYGLVYDIAELGSTVASISNDVIILGQYMDSSIAGLTYDLAKQGVTVTNLVSDVTLIGQKVGNNTSGLIYQLALMGKNVAAITADVTLIGQEIGNEKYGLIYDLASIKATVTSIDSDVILLGKTIGNEKRGLIYDLASIRADVTSIDTDVILLGKKIGNEKYGLIYDLASIRADVTSIDTDVILLGKTIGNEKRGLIYDLASIRADVTSIDTDVILLGKKIGNEKYGLVYDLASIRADVTSIDTDVILLGRTIGNEKRGLIYDLASIRADVTSIDTDVILLGKTIGNEKRGLIYDLASIKKTVTSIDTDVTLIGNTVGNSTRGLVYDLAKMGTSVTVLNNAINIINADQLTDEQKEQIKECAKQGLTVTAIGSDIVDIRGQINAAKARIGTLESDYIKTANLQATIGNLEYVQVKSLSGTTAQSSTTMDSYYGNHYYVHKAGGAGSVTNVDLSAGVYDIQIVSDGADGYILQKKSATGTWTDAGNFKRAAGGSANFVSGSWSSNKFTYKIDPSGTSNTGNIFIGSAVGKFPNDTNYYAYATRWNSTSTTPELISSTSKKLTIEDQNDNNVKLMVDNVYSGLMFYHGKYKAGYNAGSAAVTISGKWSNGVPYTSGPSNTITVSTKNRVKADDGTPNEASVSWTPTLDTTNNNIAYIRIGSSDNTIIAKSQHNAYNRGSAAVTISGKWSNGVPYTSGPSNTITVSTKNRVKADDGTPNEASVSWTPTLDTTNNNIAYIRIGSGDNAIIAKSQHNAYNRGSAAVTISGKWSNGVPYTSGPSNTITVSTKNRVKADDGTPNEASVSWTPTLDTTDDNIAYIRIGSSDNTIIAKSQHNAYNRGSAAGYNRGSAAVTISGKWSNDIPHTSGPSNTLTVTTNNRVKADGTANEMHLSWTPYLDAETNNNIAYIRFDSTSGRIIAQKTHNAYNRGSAAGYNKGSASVSMSSSWANELTANSAGTSNTLTIKTNRLNTDGTENPQTKTFSMYLDAESDNNIAYVRLGSMSATSIVAKSAHNKFKNGWTAAYNSINGLSYASSVTGSRYSFFPTSNATGTTYESLIKVAKPSSTSGGSPTTYSYYLTNNGNFVNLRYNSTSGNVVARVAASDAVSNGWTSCRNSIMNGTYTVNGVDYNYFPTATPSTLLDYMKVRIPNSTVNGSPTVITYYLTTYSSSSVEQNEWVYLKCNNAKSGTNSARIRHGKYTKAWTDCRDSIMEGTYTVNGVDYSYFPKTKPSTILDYIKVRTPHVTAGGNPTVIAYTLDSESKNVTNLRCGTAENGVIVARIVHDKYKKGWKACRDSVLGKKYTWNGVDCSYFPTKMNSTQISNQIRVLIPSETVDSTSPTEMKYYLDAKSNKDVAYLCCNSATKADDDANLVAKVEHGYYTSGVTAGKKQAIGSLAYENITSISGISGMNSDLSFIRECDIKILANNLSSAIGAKGNNAYRAIKFTIKYGTSSRKVGIYFV